MVIFSVNIFEIFYAITYDIYNYIVESENNATASARPTADQRGTIITHNEDGKHQGKKGY